MRRPLYALILGLLVPASAAAQAAPVPVPSPNPAPVPFATLSPLAPVRPVDRSDRLQPEPMAELSARMAELDRVRQSVSVAVGGAQAAAERQRAVTAVTLDGLRGGTSYSSGLNALQARQYDRAITTFDRVIGAKTDRADAALYWKAFAQYKLGRTDDTLASIGQLRREYAQSRYLADAKVLEADARKTAGRPVNPADADNDEIKLLAIQGLSRSEQAIPLLEGVLGATNSLSVKKRALYVLALSDDARAHEALMRYAKGGGNPDLQVEAIRYLASRKDSKSTPAELREIYDGTEDAGVRMAIVNAYRTWGDKAALLRIATDAGASLDIRRSAIGELTGLLTGLADAQDIMTVYGTLTDVSLRSQVAALLGSFQAYSQLTTIAQTDKDASVRMAAVRALGNRHNSQATQALVGLYGSELDLAVRRAVIQSLSNQDADTLVALAKKETNLELKRELVRRLSDLAPTSKVAADFLMEQLK